MKIKAALILAAAALSASSAAALAEGDEIQYYDVSAYINNYPIPCYCIHNYCGVYVRDLRSFGFDVDYTWDTKTVDIRLDPSCTSIAGAGDVKLPAKKNGSVYAVSEATQNRVILNGSTEIPSYCVDGSMMILLDDMTPFGNVEWDNERRALFLTIPSLPETEYRPLEKELRSYSRYKPPVYELDAASYAGLSSSVIEWGMKRVIGGAPEIEGWRVSMLNSYDAYYMDQSQPHKIYLTFDEGYENGCTPKILDVLSKYNVPATFFVTGQFLDESGYLVREMIDRGFTVGNHTVNHRNLAKISIGDVMSEIDGVSNRLRDDYGYKTVYMRPPEGAFSERALAIARDMGYNTILWSFAYYDYEPSDQKGEAYAYDMITKYMHDGAIYLLHAVSSDNANVLERVIQYALANGYEFGSLDELCDP